MAIENGNDSNIACAASVGAIITAAPSSSIPEFLQFFTLRRILLLAFLVRLLPVFFSTGYAMIDDHFLVVEVAQSWAEGTDIFQWLPDPAHGIVEPKEHTLFYTAVHAVLFRAMDASHITDPQVKMVLIRFLHALYSLLVVYFGYRIAHHLAGAEAATYTGLLLALLWFMPILSVRNLVEMACIPPLMAATWWLIEEERSLRTAIIAGLVIGFSFCIRYQTALYIGGMGLAMLYDKRWKQAILFGIGCLITVAIFQLSADIYLWGYPFAQFWAYVKYNIAYGGGFIQGHWFKYLLLIAGVVLPPVSLMFMFGFFRQVRERLLIFLPVFLFFIFHSYFINKQERFILPIIPMFVVMGCTGWYVYQAASPYWRRHVRLQRGIIWFAAVLNLILLLPVSLASTKTSKMDAMYYLYKKGDVRTFIVEADQASSFELMPRFYLGRFIPYNTVKADMSAAQLKDFIKDNTAQPNYVIFLSDHDLDHRLSLFRASYPHIELLKEIQPGWIDRLFHTLNPVNKNEPCYIYRIDA